MSQIDGYDSAFVIMAFVVQLALIAHSALRRWAFATAMRYGPLIYGLGIPSMLVSTALLLENNPWHFWLAGFIYFAWAIFGYIVEYVLHLSWRSPIRWSILIPYGFLYLASMMFYWWPLALIDRSLWYVYAVLFVISTFLNVTSHGAPAEAEHPQRIHA